MRAEAMKPYESSYTPPRSGKRPLLWALIGVAGFIEDKVLMLNSTGQLFYDG
jgi:hypothetical protein